MAEVCSPLDKRLRGEELRNKITDPSDQKVLEKIKESFSKLLAKIKEGLQALVTKLLGKKGTGPSPSLS